MIAPVDRVPQSLSVRRADDVPLGDVHRRVEVDGAVACWAKFATLCAFIAFLYHGDEITLRSCVTLLKCLFSQFVLESPTQPYPPLPTPHYGAGLWQ